MMPTSDEWNRECGLSVSDPDEDLCVEGTYMHMPALLLLYKQMHVVHVFVYDVRHLL